MFQQAFPCACFSMLTSGAGSGMVSGNVRCDPALLYGRFMSTQAKCTTMSRVLALLTILVPQATVAQLKLYDNFSSSRIDPSKWIGEPASLVGGGDRDRREVSVGLSGEGENRRLRISQTSYSAITDNSGSSGIGFGLGFIQPSHVNAVSFTLAVDEVQVVDCGNNFSYGTIGFSGD